MNNTVLEKVIVDTMKASSTDCPVFPMIYWKLKIMLNKEKIIKYNFLISFLLTLSWMQFKTNRLKLLPYFFFFGGGGELDNELLVKASDKKD